MPVPLILVAAGVVAVGALIKGGSDTLDAMDRKDKAKAKLEAANTTYRRKFEDYKSYHLETERQLQQLGRKRAEGMRAVRKAIAFIKKAKLQNPDIISDSDVRMEQMAELDQVYRDILKSLGGTAGSVSAGAGVGALTAMGAYGLVGTFGTASTGAAIGGLSGAAASSATLAWFGGGAVAAGGLGIAAGTAVLGGIVAVPAVVAFGLFKKHEADKFEKEVDRKIQKLKLEEAKIDRDRAKLLAIRRRADELRLTINRIAKELRTVLRNSNPDQDEDVYRVVQLAKVLRAALDEPAIPR